MTSPFLLRRARDLLAGGGLVAHPTEGVYGLACDPDNRAALLRMLALKGRDADKGFILLAASLADLEPYCATLPDDLRRRLEAAWPGPVTYIVPAASHIDPLITGGRPGVAVRITAHPLSRALCRTCGHALISTSANRSGRRAAHSALRVRRQLGADIDLILSGPLGGRRRPTAIVDALTGQTLRAG